MSKSKSVETTKPAKKTLVEQFVAARRCGTPLLAIQTSDQFATRSRIAQLVNGKTPFIQWDCINGFRTINDFGKEALAKSGMSGKPSDYVDFAGAAEVLSALPGSDGTKMGAVVFILNAQRHLNSAAEVQLVANLRDQYKTNSRTLVLMMPQCQLPAELQTDVIVLDEPLPTPAELEQIVTDVHKAANVTAHPETIHRAVEAVQGLPAFAAEQVTAMSMSREGLDLDALWERKRQQIEQTPGLSVTREGFKFDDLGGLSTVKEYLRALLDGNGRPNAIVFIDEIEKMLAGTGDTSGVSQDQLGQLLNYMQDNRANGILLVGHAGSGKSAIAKATGNEAGVPTIKLDLGAAKGSLVGQSEAQLRTALKVITSVSNGSSLWIATCNSLASLPPELRRRFKSGIFFFDLPTEEERNSIWQVHRAKNNVSPKDELPTDTGWTGAEIEQCCELSYRLNKPLKFAAKYVVPLSQSASDRIEGLRAQADGRWLSASHDGVYKKADDAQQMASAEQMGGTRKMSFDN